MIQTINIQLFVVWLVAALVTGLGAFALWRYQVHRHKRLGPPAKETSFFTALGRLGLCSTLLGIVLVVIAVARPRGQPEVSTVRTRGADIAVCLDCSRSMSATDLPPDRMEAARRKILTLVKGDRGHRVALIPFARTPVLRCPPTGDATALTTMVRDCDPGLFPAEYGLQGTAIGKAVSFAVETLQKERNRGQAILVVSDGGDPKPKEVEEAAKAARAAGLSVSGLAIGVAGQTATIPVEGKNVEVPMDPKTLDTLALDTGGIRVSSTLDDKDVQTLLDFFDRASQNRPWEERRRQVASERYQWFLIPGIILIALGILLPTGSRRRA
jgi:Ca-activated chloride channel family protein